MEYTCKKCGEINDVSFNEAHLKITGMDKWESVVKSETVEKIKRKAYKAVDGKDEDGREYTTLFLSTIFRTRLLSELTGTRHESDPTPLDIFTNDVVPALEKVMANCNVLGALAPPSTIQLAQTDLSCPQCVFVFLTVENNPQLLHTLRRLDLLSLIVEGACDTIKGKNWWPDESGLPKD